MSHGVRRRHMQVGTGAGGGDTRRVHGGDFRVEPQAGLYEGQLETEPIAMPDVPAGIIDGRTHIHPGTIDLPSFAETIRAPVVADTLPTLPSATYPEGSLVFLTTNGKLYRNVANAWTAEVAAVDLVANWLTAGAIAVGAIGANELAADSVRAHHVLLAGLLGEHLGGGLLRISTTTGFLDGMQIVDSVSGDLLASFDESGIKIIDPADGSRYMLLDAGQIKFTTDDGLTFPAAITPDGINATAVNFGALPGGHNLILNSSFELADFVAAASTFVFTDTVNWAVANRVTALDNITEGTSLSMTAAGFA